MIYPINNQRIVLDSRPVGAPIAENFRLESSVVSAPIDGQVLLHTLYLSLDPYMRGRMNAGPSYARSIGLNEVMEGGTVSFVVASKHPGFHEGDLVLGSTGWQQYTLSDGSGLTLLEFDHDRIHPSYALGVLGMPGFTAYTGLLMIGQPKTKETVVVAAASGAVGSVVGQIAKLKGCHVVGIAGGADKCEYVVDALGFDACIDHNAFAFATQLASTCANGIDVYYENVGGKIFDAVLPLLNVGARVPVCGLIAHYNETTPSSEPNRLPLLMRTILTKRIKMQGFIISDHYGIEFTKFSQDMHSWLASGQVKPVVDLVEGLENAPQAFIGLLSGKNFGKVVVRVAA